MANTYLNKTHYLKTGVKKIDLNLILINNE